ncbi:MAG: hypothetical protein ACREVC_12115 [Burkholderiales bacterium]
MSVWCHIVGFLDHWQSLMAGLLGFAAAIIAVVLTLLAEHRRRNKETSALKVALGAEIRQFALRAYDAHQAVRHRLENRELLSVRQLDDDARFPAPIIYPNVANALGMLREHAHAVVVFYGRVALIRDAITRLHEEPPPNDHADYGPTAVMLADALLDACYGVQGVLHAFAGTPGSENDAKFVADVTDARRTWDAQKGGLLHPPSFQGGGWTS